MAVRPIDGNELLDIERLLDTDVVRQSKTASWLLGQVLHDIQAMPTLTPPKEPLTLDELLTMDGEPVYVVFRPDSSGEKSQSWALVGGLTMKRLTDEAVEMVMERLEALHETT